MESQDKDEFRSMSYKEFNSDGEVRSVSISTVSLARKFRKNSTPAERFLWGHLRGRQFFDFKFTRQHPIANCIVDFYCHEKRLIIEVDGSIHDEIEVKEKDQIRQEYLEGLGYNVLRLTNDQVLKNIDDCLSKIHYYLQSA